MPANTVPIYSLTGKIQWSGLLKTANTAKDGTGTVETIFTAGANGSRVERIRVRAVGTNTQTVLRIFINNGSDPTVAANNVLYAEKTISGTSISETTAQTLQELPDTALATPTDTTAFPIVLPAGYRLLATIGTTIAAGIRICAIGSDY